MNLLCKVYLHSVLDCHFFRAGRDEMNKNTPVQKGGGPFEPERGGEGVYGNFSNTSRAASLSIQESYLKEA